MIQNEIMQILKDNSIINCAIEDLDVDDDLIEVGLDSFNYIQLIVLLEEKYSFEFDISDFSVESINTVSKIEQYVLCHIEDIEKLSKD